MTVISVMQQILWINSQGTPDQQVPQVPLFPNWVATKSRNQMLAGSS
jgi:hypothetical protein